MFFNKTSKRLRETEDELMTTQTLLQQNKEALLQKEEALATAESGLSIVKAELLSVQKDSENLKNVVSELLTKYGALVDIDKAIEEKNADAEHVQTHLQELKAKYQTGMDTYKTLEKEIGLYQDSLSLTEYGLYESKYKFEFPEQYKVELESVCQRQKQMINNETATICSTEWTVGNSKVEGRRMTRNYSKLMLYAFNGECDAQIARIKWNNVTKIEERIRHAFVNINKLGSSHKITLSDGFLELKVKEMSLVYEYEQKKYEEKEEQRRIREQMREEEKAQRDFERAQKDAEDEERRYQKALDKAKQEFEQNNNSVNVDVLRDTIDRLEKNLHEAQEKKERAVSMAQMTKAGHIYIISNIGSFGEDVYKIGMTRRLDPHDRIRELGDASVPFFFDVHAVIYSDNAPQLENELHIKFKDKRLNRINNRKEFFRVSLTEIEEFVLAHTNAEISFTRLAEAREFRETLTLLEKLSLPSEVTSINDKFPSSL